MLLGILLARWAWLLLSPAGAALPTANGNDPTEAAQLFGMTDAHGAQALSPASNIQLIGVFARKTNGFAIMQVDGKQVGVAQGEEVRPGLRLLETHAKYVMLEQGGGTLRVDLQTATTTGGTAKPSNTEVRRGAAKPPGNQVGRSPAPMPTPRPVTGPPHTGNQRLDILERQLDTSPNMPSVKRKMLQHQIDNLRKHSR